MLPVIWPHFPLVNLVASHWAKALGTGWVKLQEQDCFENVPREPSKSCCIWRTIANFFDFTRFIIVSMDGGHRHSHPPFPEYASPFFHLSALLPVGTTDPQRVEGMALGDFQIGINGYYMLPHTHTQPKSDFLERMGRCSTLTCCSCLPEAVCCLF